MPNTSGGGGGGKSGSATGKSGGGAASRQIPTGISSTEYAAVSKYIDSQGDFTKAYFTDYRKGKVSREQKKIIERIPGLSKVTPERVMQDHQTITESQLNKIANSKTIGTHNIGLGATTMNMDKPLARTLRESIKTGTPAFLIGGYSGFSINTAPPIGNDSFWKATGRTLYQVNPERITQKNGVVRDKWTETPVLSVK